MVASSAVLPQLAVVAHLIAPATSTTTSSSEVETLALSAATWFYDLEVLPREKVRGALETDLRACGPDNRCASARLAQHGIDSALYVVVNLEARFVTIEVVKQREVVSEITPIRADVAQAITTAVRRALGQAGHRLGARMAVEAAPAEALVRLGSSLAPLPVGAPVVLAPGRHVLEISLDGFETERREVDLSAGEDRIVEVTLRERESVLSSWWLWSLVGVAVVSAVSVPLAVRFSDRSHTVCTSNPPELCE